MENGLRGGNDYGGNQSNRHMSCQVGANVSDLKYDLWMAIQENYIIASASHEKIPYGLEHADTLKSYSISLGGSKMYGHMLLYMNIMFYGAVLQAEGSINLFTNVIKLQFIHAMTWLHLFYDEHVFNEA